MKMGSLINEMSNMVTLEDFDAKIKALAVQENPNFPFSKKIENLDSKVNSLKDIISRLLAIE